MISGQGDDELRALVAEVRAGRKAALERLLARVQASVRRWAGRYASDEDAADDIAQDVLIGLERRVQRFDGASRFSTWLFSVTRNVALSRRRLETRRAALVAEQQRFALDDARDVSDPDAARLAALALRYFDALPRSSVASSSSWTFVASRPPRSPAGSRWSSPPCAGICSRRDARFASSCSSTTNDC